jgi:hypothetical protein
MVTLLDLLNSADYTILKQRNGLSLICHSFTYLKINNSDKWDDEFLDIFYHTCKYSQKNSGHKSSKRYSRRTKFMEAA